MKFILLFACSIALSSVSYSQTTSPVQKENTVDAGFQEYCKKIALSIIEVSPAANPTYLDYNITLKENEAQYFSIKGSDKVIKVESLYRLRMGYNQKKS
jgi:hypothetical protein